MNRRDERARLTAAVRLLAAASKALVPHLAGVATDPRKLKPGELIRLLNSTPLGSILTDRVLRKQRERAGLRIGDGKTLDLFRYAGWLADSYHRQRQQESSTPAAGIPQGTTLDFLSAYEKKKERERERNAAASREGRDIGELPPVADPERRARALADPELFATTYFPGRFKKKMSDDQGTSLEELQRVAEEGGKKVFAAPRGDGKTTRSEVMTIWAILSGKRRFVALVGATRTASLENLESIKGEFESNELLLADFPEVCFPVHCLEGIHNKCKGQRYQGKPTLMKWAGDMFVLPTIEGSPASGAVICCRGILGRIRGMKYRRPDGETIRPDMVIVDDPQTRASARSDLQTDRRLKIVLGDCLGLAGPGESIAFFMPCTVIELNDLADQLLDREKYPAFQGVRTKLVHTFPTNEKLWDEYSEIRRAGLRNDDLRTANAFYKKNRKAMDAGAVVAWDARFDEEVGEISAVQHAMNLRIDNPDTFDAEYQNEPRDETDDDDKRPTAAEIEGKLSGLPRRKVHLASTKVTGFIDVQQRALYWGVAAWSPTFSGGLIDYGAWPDQGRSNFLYRDVVKGIPQKFPTADVTGAIRGALDALIEQLMGTEYEREDGATYRIERLLVDSGDWSDVVYACCRESAHASALLPSKGMGITADKVRISEWKRHEGRIIGEEWQLGAVENKRAVRLLTYDTNFWKRRLDLGISTVAGDRGCISVFGEKRKPPDHSMLARHCLGETREKTTGRGRTVYVYKLRPEKPDNHLFDVWVGNLVCASLLGCRLVGKPLIREKKPPRDRVRSLTL